MRTATAQARIDQQAARFAIREGHNRPYPRHWIELASLLGIAKDNSEL